MKASLVGEMRQLTFTYWLTGWLLFGACANTATEKASSDARFPVLEQDRPLLESTVIHVLDIAQSGEVEQLNDLFAYQGDDSERFLQDAYRVEEDEGREILRQRHTELQQLLLDAPEFSVVLPDSFTRTASGDLFDVDLNAFSTDHRTATFRLIRYRNQFLVVDITNP